MIQDIEIKCNNCDWQGDENELKIIREQEEFFKGCPNCETDSYLSEIEKTSLTNF